MRPSRPVHHAFRATSALLVLLAMPPAIARADAVGARPVWAQSGVHLSAPLERMLRDQLASGVKLPPAVVRRWGLDLGDEFASAEEAAARLGAVPFRAEHTATVGLSPDHEINDKSGDVTCSACGFRPLSQAETTIAAQGGHLLAGWNDARGFCVPTAPVQGYGWSLDNGATWTDAGDVPGLPTGGRYRGDPVHAVNRKTGDFYILGLYEGGAAGSGMAMLRGHFTGVGFTIDDNRQIAVGGTNFIDKPWMAADSLTGNLYVTYSNFVGGSLSQIELIRSTNNGANWSAPLVLSSPAGFGNVQGSRPIVGPGGELYVVWYEYGYPLSHMRVRRSNDFGVSFGPEITVTDFYENGFSGAPGYRRPFAPTLPSAAVDLSAGPHRGRLYVAWDEAVDFYDAPFPAFPLFVTESESDDFFARAVPFTVGNTVRGAMSGPTDLDFYTFSGSSGQTLFFAADSARDSSSIDVHLVCASDTSAVANYRYLAYTQSRFPAFAFTLPATGTYFMRINSTAGALTTGAYRIRTTWDTPTPGERARDHRDRFVVWSDDGASWSAATRLNDDPPRFDGIFPELSVDGLGRVHAYWHDFRDDAGCGALSYEYMTSSGDGGVTWGANQRVSDVQSFWSFNACGSANQGDYQGITSQDATVYPCWTDNRLGDPDPFMESARLDYAANCPVPVATDDGRDTTIAFAVPNSGNTDGTYAVTFTDNAGWITGVSPPPGPAVNVAASGTAIFQVTVHVPTSCTPVVDDTVTLVAANTVIPGEIHRCGTAVHCHLVTAVSDGAVRALEFAPPRPNPSGGTVRFAFALPRGDRVRLGVFSASGARVRQLTAASWPAGAHELVWDGHDERGNPVRAGVYWAKLEVAGRSLRQPVVLVK